MMEKISWRKVLIGEISWRRLIRSILIIYLALFLFAWFYSDPLLFRPHRPGYKDSKHVIKLTTSDGCKISAVYFPNPQSDFVLLYSHGNGEDLADVQPCLDDLNQLNFSVFAYDYHGYGTSEGAPTEEHVYNDIEAAFKYLTKDLQIPLNRIVIYGRSVGSGPSVYLASREKVAGLVLESPFTSAFLTATRVPILPFDRFPNLKRIHDVHCPVLIMHGKQDQVVPFTHGQKLFQSANEPKRFVPFENSGHNDLGYIDETLYKDVLSRFLKEMIDLH